MALSTSTDLRARPSREHSPAVMSNTNRAAAAITTSEISRARPTSMPVYFFRIMAAMSVPPEEASMLKRMAEPRAGRITAKKSSSTSWSVRGALMGNTQENTWIMPADSREQYTVRKPKPLSSTRNPTTRKSTLMTEL